MRRYGVSASTSSGGSVPGCFATSSSQRTSRPGVIGAPEPSRSQTTTCSTDGDVSSASSTTSFIGIVLPRRSDASAVITTFASESWSRAATAWAAKPEKIGIWIAPRCATAFEAIAASGAIGRYVATTSPGPTPSEARPSASRVTSRESAAKVSSRRSPSSPAKTAPTSSGRRSAQRWTQFHAMLSFAADEPGRPLGPAREVGDPLPRRRRTRAPCPRSPPARTSPDRPVSAAGRPGSRRSRACA